MSMYEKLVSKLIQWWFQPSDHHKNKNKVKNDYERSLPEVIESRGFKCEVHEVTTDDGYILTLFRVVHPRDENQYEPDNLSDNGKKQYEPLFKKPLLLMHGMAGNASQFIVTSNDGYLKANEEDNLADRDNNLCFYLAKHHYDVWIGNMRGGRYCLKHKQGWKYSPESEEFWDFSLDEVVKYDLPNCIDYIRNLTNHNKIGYIGVSLGTTVMFGLLSSQEKYNEIIEPFISLSPCYRLFNMKSPIKWPLALISYFWNKYPRLKPEFSLESELNLHRKMVSDPVKGTFRTHFTWFIMGILGGYNYEQFDFDRVCVYAAHQASLWWPWKMLIHSGQYVCNNVPFSKFDYGKEKNMELYGSEIATLYDVSKITCKSMGFFYSKNDWACSVTDVNFLKEQLTVPLLYDYLVSDEKWCHYDFLLAKDCGKIIYPHVNKVIEISCGKTDETSSSSNVRSLDSFSDLL